MIKNYFLVAWRNMIRNKAFSVINILGLALGMTCSLFIFLWIRDERGVDGFHKNGPQLYQVYERDYFDGKVHADYPTQGLLAEELKKTIPEVQYASGFEWNSINTFEAQNKILKMSGSFAGGDFFTMFSYPLLQGTPQTALNSLEGIAISRKMAELFFGSPAAAMGKAIRFENSDNFQVSAVFENLPANSSLQFDFLRSWLAFKKENEDWIHNWGNTDGPTFVQLRPDANPAKVSAEIKEFIYRYQQRSKAFKVELDLQPFPEKYLHSTFKNGRIDGGRIEYVHLFTMVAVFILLIACINFMNLATARSTKRAKEVGVRKVIGAARPALIAQFMGEALLLTFFSIFIAVSLTALLLPAFNTLTGKQLSLPVHQPVFWLAMLGLLLLSGFVSGSYPAIFLSALKPIRVLKGALKPGGGASFFRKALVVFQFGLSMVFLVGMIVIYRQLDFVQRINLGFDRNNLVYIPLEGELSQKYELFKQEAEELPAIMQVSKLRQPPTSMFTHTGDIRWVGKDPNVVVSFVQSDVGYDFVKTMDLKLAGGRDFSPAYPTDSAGFILNETAVKKIGYTDPIGKTMWWGQHPGKIIGVLKDFHFTSLHQPIEPLIIHMNEQRTSGTILVRLRAGRDKEGLASLEKLCRELNPAFPFSYQFSDAEYNKSYRGEQLVGKLANYFAFLAVFISCLGLLGLATFTAEQRTREIGVRKVLGASVPGIVSLLSKDFLALVLIAIVIASPIAWYSVYSWLQGFAYRTPISWWIFAAAGVSALLIAFLTVSFQAVRAASVNPVDSLRSE
ncbi:MAG TPA: ABC transporter permease [Puia sp.]|jgi:putative ABC transport system permease protein|nr:ABC transporter permease [Puia sp.]